MKKHLKVFFGTIIIGLFLLGGCANERSETLVGEWALDHTVYGEVFVFESDGTGRRGFHTEQETFTWSTNGNQLRINRDSAPQGEIRNERWNYSIVGNRLTLTSRQAANLEYTFILQYRDNALLGEWAFEFDANIRMIFHADGTAQQGGGFGPLVDTTWSTAEGVLTMDFGALNTMYVISGNRLTITDTVGHSAGIPFDLFRISTDPTLVGTWAWDEDSTWTYNFNADGTGRRGGAEHGGYTSFNWLTGEGGRIWIIDGVESEIWHYVITGNVITFDGRFMEAPEIVLSFLRQ